MKDSLEDFIHKNRETFDYREPASTVWRGIDSSLPNKPSPGIWQSVVVWRAAAIVLLGLLVASVLTQNKQPNKKELAVIQKDFGDLESYYSGQISEKTELVNRFQTQTGMTEDEITQNMKKLEAMYLVLKDELKIKPTQDVKDALVLNLLIRIDLLNQQLNKLDKRKSIPKEEQKISS